MATDIIGLLGKKRSGKSTLAAYLERDHGYTVLSLADPLRAMALALDPWVVPVTTDNAYDKRLSWVIETWGWDGVKDTAWGPEVRRLLQRLGTEAVRDILGPSTWAAHLVDRAEAVSGPVVVPDVRFPEEYAAIDLAFEGASFIRITGRGETGDTHPSETALDGYPVDLEFCNVGPVEDLRALAGRISRFDLPIFEPRH